MFLIYCQGPGDNKRGIRYVYGTGYHVMLKTREFRRLSDVCVKHSAKSKSPVNVNVTHRRTFSHRASLTSAQVNLHF